MTTFYKAARENTGSHFLDSGSIYGRHHERPPLTPDTPLIQLEACGGEILASIETARWLDEVFEVEEDLQSAFVEFSDHEDRRCMSYFEDGEDFMEAHGYVQVARENVYNAESDFSQVFVWEVYLPEDEAGDDWAYSKEAIVSIYIHTGCDVRGGYARPIFCRACTDDELSMPLDWCAGYKAIEGRDAEGNELPPDRLHKISEAWQQGYSHYPAGELRDSVERVFPYTLDNSDGYHPTVCALLKSGERVKIMADAGWYIY